MSIVLGVFPGNPETSPVEQIVETEANLEARLIFGSYPEIVLTNDNSLRERYLKEISSSYLFKDILEMEGVKHPDKIVRLLRLLAFQIGGRLLKGSLYWKYSWQKNPAFQRMTTRRSRISSLSWDICR